MDLTLCANVKSDQSTCTGLYMHSLYISASEYKLVHCQESLCDVIHSAWLDSVM